MPYTVSSSSKYPPNLSTSPDELVHFDIRQYAPPIRTIASTTKAPSNDPSYYEWANVSPSDMKKYKDFVPPQNNKTNNNGR